MKEIWKTIPGYEGYYEASTRGRVRSLDRIVNNLNKTDNRKQKIIKPHLAGRGYLELLLSKDGAKQHKLVHRLIAETFLPNPNMLPQVNHKDENKTNNCIENLEWCTAKYNMNYGTIKEQLGKNKRKPVLQLSKNGDIINTFNSLTEAAKLTGVCCRNICSVCFGKRVTAGGYKWKYKTQSYGT